MIDRDPLKPQFLASRRVFVLLSTSLLFALEVCKVFIIEMHRNQSKEPIAVVGSACHFPGKVTSPSKLWDLLKAPRDLKREIPDERFNVDRFYHSDNMHHGTSNIRHSYLLEEDFKAFDANFFGVKPVEAVAMDPQQRLLLETVFEGLEAAGLRMEQLQGSQTGVFVGNMGADYADIISQDLDSIPTYFASGTARSILSNRISYFFDWRGPSVMIDTACSSSLVAVHQAVQSLRAGESSLAIAAGANLLLGPAQYVAESKLKMLSPNGISRMWDEAADGYARGEGFAAVVLKTLSAAIQHGDHIECLIRETGFNQDGRTKGEKHFPDYFACSKIERGSSIKQIPVHVEKQHRHGIWNDGTYPIVIAV